MRNRYRNPESAAGSEHRLPVEVVMKERRGSPRLEEQRSVKVTVLSMPKAPELENKIFECTTEDVSARGLRFYADTALPQGSAIELRLSAADSSGAFWHVGRVRWVKPMDDGIRYAVGVHFTETPEATLEAWEEMLREKLTRKAG